MKSAALIGNPNTGKTSLFNILTSSYEYVGNWSGVTVEKKVGQLRNKSGFITDLPGIYSLHPLSKDEGVATNYLLTESPSVIVNIVDASQLERNLYLTVQLLEYGKPVIIGLNMIDVAKARGIKVLPEVMASRLRAEVVPLIARTGEGNQQLLMCMDKVGSPSAPAPQEVLLLDYGRTLEEAVKALIPILEKSHSLQGCPASKRWLALQLLEENSVVTQSLTPAELENIASITARCAQQLNKEGIKESVPELIRSVRTSFIQALCNEAVDRSEQKPHNLTEKIDAIVAHPLLGIPIFLLFMFMMFQLTFDWLGNPLSDLLDSFISGPLSQGVSLGLDAVGASSFTRSLVIDGVIAGVGGVLVFLPQIFILFLMISFIEDSGYMARITLLTDRLLEKVGLNGKAIIPFILGFGCNVPAIMASRSIEQPKERTLTMLLVPLMSCSARLPVYALFAGIFFTRYQAFVVLGLYVLGILLALILAKLFSSVLFKDKPSFFVVELPPYRMPQSVTLLRSTWEKGKGFLRKAGTFILGGSVIIWLLTYCGPSGISVSMDESFLAKLGGLFASILAPLGFGTWQSGASLVTGFMAKEIVVSTMNIIYHVSDSGGLQQQISTAFTPLQGLSFMTFVLLYTPCLATVGVLRKETASWRWTLFSIGYSLLLAYFIALIVYQGGLLLGFS
ncbi:ferrous iron transport protein B [Paenibacillus sp. CAA11]|uniref:ferrous iron transport protein B n=1 Tax=Paenibacillus sp. CAA11 TaxID=1532905 RepID=UPI000D34AE68|nr:ferrous iron transport protein B [Paenibacillus sp. CAA11]AWB43931.1 ferrous iron transport protein B [Paenibacillus sp. CAA11]